ncbi:uncharacterized protein mdfi [Synchiropus picturatus]
MDEERSASATSPDPHDGDASPATTQPKPNTNASTLSKLEPNTTPSTDVAFTQPLILRSEVIPERSQGEEEDGHKGDLPHAELLTPSKHITCQPVARSTPIHPTQPCRTQPSGQLRNGIKHQTHCPHHTPQANGERNGAPHGHPKLGSLPRGGSSTSSSSSAGNRHTKKLQSNPSITSQSSKRSKGSSKSSSKSNSSQIPTDAQDDCCVHCILACLFCEFLTLCNIVLDCATCGSCAGDDSCFCCCCMTEECGDCDLPCDMDCGIIDACCESADCLEICMECCSLCFSS